MLNKAICIHNNVNEAKRETLFKIFDGPCPSIPQTRGKKLNINKIWYVFYTIKIMIYLSQHKENRISSNKMKVHTYHFKTSVSLSDICFRKKIFQLPLDPLNSWNFMTQKYRILNKGHLLNQISTLFQVLGSHIYYSTLETYYKKKVCLQFWPSWNTSKQCIKLPVLLSGSIKVIKPLKTLIEVLN